MGSSHTTIDFGGLEFEGGDLLAVPDISDWTVDGFGGDSAKSTLDEFDWDGNAVIGITLKTSPDNRKVTSSKMFTAGLLMKNRREIRANRLFPEADKELRISYMIEDDNIDREVIKKTAAGSSTLLTEQQ